MYRDRDQKNELSRRQMLLGLGVLGGCSALCSITGLSALTYQYASRKNVAATVIATLQPLTATPEIPRPPMVSREDWGAWPPDHKAANEEGFVSADNPEGWMVYPGELYDAYQTAVIHHAALYEETDIATLHEVQRLHRIDRQWADVAYHFLVGRSGTIYEGRDWTVRGTHVAGYNTGSIGICLLGNFMTQHPSSEQITAAQNLVVWLAYRLQLTHIAGHRNFNPETFCPGDNLVALIAQFAAAANLQVGIDGYIVPVTGQTQCLCCDCSSDQV